MLILRLQAVGCNVCKKQVPTPDEVIPETWQIVDTFDHRCENEACRKVPSISKLVEKKSMYEISWK